MKVSQRWQDLRARISKANETRFFLKHGVSSWREYDLKYDVDYNHRADTIRGMFHGYPYIAEISKSTAIQAHAKSSIEDGFTVLKNWLEHNCRGKARHTLERTIFIKETYNGKVYTDWFLNSLGGQDTVFVGFQDERDYMMFLLKWETG